MTYNWDGLFKKLSKPWWGPLPPYKYIIKEGQAAVGVGLLVGAPNWDYGAWNLTLLDAGSFDNPDTAEGHRQMLIRYISATRVAKLSVDHQPLGSYTMLMDLHEFHAWLRGLSKAALGKESKQLLLMSTERLIGKLKEPSIR